MDGLDGSPLPGEPAVELGEQAAQVAPEALDPDVNGDVEDGRGNAALPEDANIDAQEIGDDIQPQMGITFGMHHQ